MAEVEAEVDRISFLPLDVKVAILSRLSINDAVRTSALSPSWRHIWTHLPCLRLSSGDDPLGYPLDDDDDDTVHSRWIQRVHSLVSSLRGPLTSFHLSFFGAPDDQSVLQSLLDLLLQKGGVQTLHLEFPESQILLPWFHSLQVLRLDGCHVVLPTDFQGFHLLETLVLFFVQISNEDLDLLLRTSNKLTHLGILNCHASRNPLSVNISLPLLRHLDFDFPQFIGKLSVVSSPCLERAGFCFQLANSNLQNLAPMMLRLVTSIAMVSSLKLEFDVLKCLSLVILPFNFTIPRLRFLRFYLNVDTMDKRVCDAFFWLLRTMPFLEELVVNLHRGDDYDQVDRVAILMRELLVKKHDGFACLERTITVVRINMFTLDVIASIAWIQFFLLNAKRLKLLRIGYFRGGDLFMPSFIEELHKAEVTSPDAKVMFFNCVTHQTTNLCMND
ncbi:hypothetical protein LUZ61_015435 [Rhynchospora tenuis]|uniref:F-box domain-containing protein n=1 Tax=Rhynchospora tenuis TaxID=198213 RepID=A0AAD5Z3L8_9POAL|nr:hypothetical protein LUZ61_015435 [Rhynchospora tenuis]